MYQFYYADAGKVSKRAEYKKKLQDEFIVEAVRPTRWEEHCLECSAPLCFENCVHYISRADGRCMRFDNGIYVEKNELGCGGESARVKFRKWANMMTIIYPGLVSKKEYKLMVKSAEKSGNKISKIVDSSLPNKIKFTGIRIPEYIHRRKLSKLKSASELPNAFVFHGYSFDDESYRLIIEIMDDHNSVFKTSLTITPGENLHILDKTKLSDECFKPGYLVKVYPENDREAEIEILWCDFVKGKRVVSEVPAKSVKCLVWDLDNTFWDGTLIETEDENTLKLKEGVLDTIKKLDERGVIQSVASKNDFDAAWPVIERLGLSEYFLYPQIHWNAKSTSIENIATSLNIGIDSLAFIDDSVFERNQVHDVWPQVRIYEDNEVAKLLDYPEFEGNVTEESKNRRMMYKAEEKRNKLMAADKSDTVEFLRKCNLRMTLFKPESKEELERCYELVVRTNQLNMSGIKYTPEEFDKVLAKEEHRTFGFDCEDDFGSYGIVGFGQYKVEDETIIFTEFAMSCRVAGKYVESALFEVLLSKEGCKDGIFKVNKTKKNILLRRTLEEIGFKTIKESPDKIKYSFEMGLLNKDLVTVKER